MSLLVSDPHRIDRLLRRHGSAVQLAVLAAFFVACAVAALLVIFHPHTKAAALSGTLIVTAVSVPGAVLFYWVHLLGDEADGDNPE